VKEMVIEKEVSGKEMIARNKIVTVALMLN